MLVVLFFLLSSPLFLLSSDFPVGLLEGALDPESVPEGAAEPVALPVLDAVFWDADDAGAADLFGGGSSRGEIEPAASRMKRFAGHGNASTRDV